MVSALLLPSGACRQKSGAEAPGAPVILISIDTLRADHLPAYGYKAVETPHIDALRRDGILFSDASSPCPLTLPAHTSILTGLLPPVHQVRNNLGYRLDAAAHPTLARLLKARGYATGAAVSAYVLAGKTGLADSFDFYDDAIARPSQVEAASQVRRPGLETARHAASWINGVGAKPFFFFLHLYEPHAPYEPPEPFRSRYPLAYDGEIAAADAIVGDFLGQLRRSGLYDRAVVILLSDHGEGLGQHGEKEHGIFLYREALHVPLIVKLPGSRQAGATVREPVGLVDVMPTLAALLGFEPPPGAAGASLLAHPGGRGRRLYAETYYPRIHLGWSELRSSWDGRFDFIDSPKPELYDTAEDPGESRDRFSQESAESRDAKRVLSGIEAAFVPPAPASAEDMKKLAALGYLTGAAPAPEGPLPVPRDEIHSIAEIEAAYGLAAAGRGEETVAALRKILARSPRLFDAQYKLADTLARLGRAGEAADAYRRAIAVSPSLAAELAVGLGRVCVKLQRWDEAEANAAIALRDHPGSAHGILARVALGRQDLDAAEREAAAARQDRDAATDAALIQTEVLIRRGKPAEALAEIENAALRHAAAGQPPVEGLAYLRGDALGRLNRTAEASAAFREEIHAFPRNSEAYARLAILLAVEHRTVKEVHGLLEGMYAANPSPETARLAVKTLESIGDRAAAAAWQARVRKAS